MKTTRVSVLMSLLILTLAITAYSQAADGRYIVVLRSKAADSASAAAQIAREHGVSVGAVYARALKGFSFSGPAQAAEAIGRLADVAYVEPDQLFHTIDLPTGIDRADVDLKIDINGAGGDLLNSAVRVAVLDTGVDRDHPDLNVAGGIRFYSFLGVIPFTDDQYDDGNGHGTHVSGTIGARDNGIDVTSNGVDYQVVGVAPGVPIYAVKVLDDNGYGYTTDIVRGIDHVADNAATIHVANMSLGGGFSQALNDAVAGAVSAGVVFVVAAGNDGNDAALHSPASEPSAITVSALADSDGTPGGSGPATSYGSDDTLATFSNHGSVVDICAPGVNILSTFPGGYAFGSGTSMASPHVAGAAALYIANAADPYDGFDRLAAGQGSNAVQAVRTALLNAGWQYGSYGYFSGDTDGFHEPLLNVGGLPLKESANSPPTADAGGPYTGTEDIQVGFTATASDPDGDTLSYSWNFGDGTTAQGQTAAHTYPWGGTFSVTLTVTDGRGGSVTDTAQVIVSEVNDGPVAAASVPAAGVVGTALTFDGSASYDYDNQDGTSANNQQLSYSWNFGDGQSGSGATLTHSYSATGTFTVALTVSDGTSAGTVSKDVIISAISLEASTRSGKRGRYIDLRWSGAVGRNVDIYRNGSKLVSTKNDGAYTDTVSSAGTHVYQIRAGSAFSNSVTVTF